MNCHPGVHDSCLEILKKKVADKKVAGSELILSICFDEMFLRKTFQWCNQTKQIIGFPTYPTRVEYDDDVDVFDKDDLNLNEAANQVIVFMAVGINERIKLPIVYHFVKSLDATQRSYLVKDVIDKVHGTGAIVNNIAFDGFSANKGMCTLLGANLNLDSPDFKPYFFYPDNNSTPIYIFCDTPHLLKCVRGILSDHEYLINGNGERIEWKYFEELVRLGKTDGFNFVHKMTQAHLQWRNKKTKVELAVQTLSRSSSNAMKYLKEQGHPKFINAGATIEFSDNFNNAFDIFNTKLQSETNLNQTQDKENTENGENVFKMPISEGNHRKYFEFIDKAIEYIKELKIISESGARKSLITSRQNTGFKGFVINMYSLMHMYKSIVESKKLLKSIPTYPMNQDAVEIFFGKCRSLNGYNDNPTIQQFKSSYRKILIHSTVFTSRKGNCINFDVIPESFSNILYVTSKGSRGEEIQADATPEELEIVMKQLEDIETLEAHNISDPSCCDPTIVHIASNIETRMKSAETYCMDCMLSLEQNRKVNMGHVVLKNRQIPCHSTYVICKAVDHYLRVQFLRGNTNLSTIYCAIVDQLDLDSLYAASDFSHDSNHKLFLIRTVLDACVQIKATLLARQANCTGKQNMRSIYRKLIHFYGQ